MATAGKVASLIDALPNCEDKREKLDELKTILIASVAPTINEVIHNVSFNAIFECLNTTNEEQLALCSDVLQLLLDRLEPPALLPQFHDELLAGLAHPSPPVKHLALKQMLRTISFSGQLVSCHGDLVVQLVALLSDDNLSVAEHVIKIIRLLAESSEGLNALSQSAVQQQLMMCMGTGDTVKFRVYAAIVAMASQSHDALQLCASSGFLQKLVNEVHQEDILLQLCALELLKDLALRPHGLVYLDGQGVVGKLEDMLSTVEENPMAGFLLPGLIKFFGNVAHIHPKEICDRFRGFATLIFKLVDGTDPSLCAVAMETIGFIGSTPEGKLALQKQGPAMTGACQQIGKTICDGSTEQRVTAVESLTHLITLRVPDQTAELLELTETWFAAVTPRPLETLIDLAQQPFPDLRVRVLAVFTAVVQLPWGQRQLNAHPGFNEYLLDRNTEKAKETKEAKYEVVKTLAESPTCLDVFGRPYQLRLEQFVNEGPFYVRVEAAVAFEEAS